MTQTSQTNPSGRHAGHRHTGPPGVSSSAAVVSPDSSRVPMNLGWELHHQLLCAQNPGKPIPVQRGDLLLRCGQPLHDLHCVLSGSFKRISHFDRRTQVTSFALRGDWLGIDALDTGLFCEDTVALQDSLVCCFPYEPLLTLLSKSAGLQREFHRMLSRQIQTGHSDIRMLGCMNAEQRVCRFLLDLKHRQQHHEAPKSTFELPMLRNDVASYLGLTAETLCRILARLERLGVLVIRFRTVDVLDLARLSRGASLDESHQACSETPAVRPPHSYPVQKDAAMMSPYRRDENRTHL